jgi:hypothetical protein
VIEADGPAASGKSFEDMPKSLREGSKEKAKAASEEVRLKPQLR